MYKELSTHDIAYALSSNKDNGFTYNGARALAEYLESCEEDGEKMELDTVALRCEYSEYASAKEASDQYGRYYDINGTAEDIEASALAWLEEHTTVIPVDGGGVVIAQF